jgi:transcriptional repressor of dcmA and dcmR
LRWWEAKMLAAIRDGASSLRAVGDVWGIAEGVSPDELLAYETQYEQRIARKLPVVTLCQYDARRFSGLAVLDALKCHRDNFQCPPELVLA